MENNRLFLFIIILLLPLLSFGQRIQQQPDQTQSDSEFQDSPDSSKVFFFKRSNVHFDSIKLEHIDTSLTRHEIYDPISRELTPYHRLGNLGLAHKPLTFNLEMKPGFELGMKGFHGYLFNHANLPYFEIWNPYTDLFYVQGPEEQLLSGKHSQRVMKNLTLGLQFRFIKSLGTYIRQKTNQSSVAGKGRYRTKNKRYAIITNYVFNKLDAEENGGIANDSLFTENIEPERELIGVKLTEDNHNAKSRVRHSGLYVQQHYYLSGFKSDNVKLADTTKIGRVTDSINSIQAVRVVDSIDSTKLHTDKPKINFSFGKLSHVFNYHKTSHIYWDNDTTTSYYPNFYPDTNNTYDSIYFHKISNEIAWSNGRIDSADQVLKLRFALRHDMVKLAWDRGFTSRYSSGEPDSIPAPSNKRFSQFIPSARFRLQLFPHLSISGYGDLVIGEVYNQGDVHLNGMINLKSIFDKTDWLSGELNLARQEPYWVLNEYSSNRFQWNNSFKKQDIINANIHYRNKNWYAGIGYYLVNNYAYLGTDTMPHQFAGELSILKADLRSHHQVGKFTFDNRLIYQQTAQNNILHLPDLIAKTALRFNLSLFNDALITQTGFSILYTSSYYGDAYVPALHSFHLQDNIETGNYPIADVFINIQIKRTRFFFKMSHVNGGFPEYNYFMSPHYPMRDREFRFGLDWKFYD